MPLQLDRDIPDSETREWAMFRHLSGLISLFFPTLPGPGAVIPANVWYAKRHDRPSIDQHGREATDFQVTMAVDTIAPWAAIAVLKVCFNGHLLVRIPALLQIAQLGDTVVGAIRAHDRERFRCPWMLRCIWLMDGYDQAVYAAV